MFWRECASNRIRKPTSELCHCITSNWHPCYDWYTYLKVHTHTQRTHAWQIDRTQNFFFLLLLFLLEMISSINRRSLFSIWRHLQCHHHHHHHHPHTIFLLFLEILSHFLFCRPILFRIPFYFNQKFWAIIFIIYFRCSHFKKEKTFTVDLFIEYKMQNKQETIENRI